METMNPLPQDADNTDTAGASATPVLRDEERTRCEVWTRVMGYHRPLASFNTGKQGEAADRVYFEERRADLA